MHTFVCSKTVDERILELEAFDAGVHGELPLYPEEDAELRALKAIRKAMASC